MIPRLVTREETPRIRSSSQSTSKESSILIEYLDDVIAPVLEMRMQVFSDQLVAMLIFLATYTLLTTGYREQCVYHDNQTYRRNSGERNSVPEPLSEPRRLSAYSMLQLCSASEKTHAIGKGVLGSFRNYHGPR